MDTQSQKLLPLYAVIFLGFLGYALTITLYIPIIMDQQLLLLPKETGISTRAALSGLLLAMYPLGQFFGSPMIGGLSDHYGRKKILLLSLLACLVGFISIALSIQFNHLSLLFISSFFTGLCESNMAISQSVIADQMQDVRLKTKYIGYTYSACSLGYVIGPLLGGLTGRFGYDIPFWITAAFVFLLLLWIFYSFKERYVSNKTTLKFSSTILSIRTLFSDPQLYKIYLINFLIFFAVMGLYRVAPLYVLDKWKPSLHIYSLLISYVSFLCLIANLFILEKLAIRFSTRNLLSGLLLVGGVLVILIIVPHRFNWIWLTYGLAVIPTVMALSTCTSWLSSQVSSHEQGQALGNNQALLVLGESVSAAIGGLLAAMAMFLPVLVMGIILLILGILLTLRLQKSNIDC